MRITQSLINHNIIRSLGTCMVNISKTQGEISSGSKLGKLSDSPDDLGTAMNVQTTLDRQEQYKKNIKSQLAWLGLNETALTDMADVMIRAKEFSINAGNPAVGDMEMASMSAEMSELIDQTMNSANTQLGQSHIFAGFQMDAPVIDNDTGLPLSYDEVQVGDKLYYENDDVLMREIAPGMTIQINMSGESMYNAINTLTDLKNALDQGDKDAALGLLEQIEDNHNELIQQRAEVGAKTKRLENLNQQMDYQQIDYQQYLSDLSGVDIGEATINLANQQLTYQASLAVSSKLLQISILDYLK